MAAKKDKLMECFRNEELKPGMEGYVLMSLLDENYTKYSNDKQVKCNITSIIGSDKIMVKHEKDEYRSNQCYIKIINKESFERDILYIGANPFNEKPWESRIRKHDYDLYGILLECGYDASYKKELSEKAFGVSIPEINFNPYVLDKDGNKRYYQRDFVWTLEEKRLFIDSIYNGLNCGSIVLRRRSWDYLEREIKNGNKEVAFTDIVDGKQRLNCLIEFVSDKFTDNYGNYYSDFSRKSEIKFKNFSGLSLLIMDEGTTDDDVIAAFLNVNFTGVPMSKEHIKYVKEIQKNMK